jgi:hypothetical protein
MQIMDWFASYYILAILLAILRRLPCLALSSSGKCVKRIDASPVAGAEERREFVPVARK